MSQRKKLLLIMPRFFNYQEIICDELTNMGYDVDFFDDRPSSNAWVKAIIRIKKEIIRGYINNYFKKIMKTIENKRYDIVFLISGQSLSFSERMIERIKESQKQASFVLYQWDSQRNFPYIKKFHKYFDKIYSFDRTDVRCTNNLKFLPLFYSKDYAEIGKKKKNEYKYDFCFVGTAHPKKYKFIKKISEQLLFIYPKQFIYYFLPSVIVFYYRKIHDKEFRYAKKGEFHYQPLRGLDICSVYENSRCVLDSAQDGQVGLTIRVMEALGAKKKLISTNKDIKNYDFYCPENIYIYDGDIDLDNIFFHSDYKAISDDIYDKYSLRSWLSEVLC